jgi:hypothetical protein
VLLGILLSKGSPPEKGQLIFDQSDLELTGKISKEKFKPIAESMISIAIDSIPTLTHENGKNSISKDRINGYIFNLKKKREVAKDKIVEGFFGDSTEITRDAFIKKFSSKTGADWSKLSTAFGVRVFLNWVFANTPDEVYS